MNVTPRHAPVRLKFVIFGTHHWSQGKPRKANGKDKWRERGDEKGESN